MTQLKTGSLATIAVFLCVIGPVFCFSTATVSAAVPLDVITGLVVDEYGQPVPNATVTLWQDGRMWQPNESVLSGIANPQTTVVEGDKEGSFLFGLLFPGQYTVTAEKYGYKGSASVQINNTNVHSPNSIIVVMEDFDAALSQEQVSYRGAISGILWDQPHEVVVRYANLYLRQNGQMVNVTNNPQNVRDGNYSFKHLAPGKYVIEVIVRDPGGNKPVGNWTIDVGTGNVTADLVLPYYVHTVGRPTTVPTPVQPSSPPAPTPPSATPAPSTSTAMILLSICFTGALFCKYRRKR